VVSSRKSETALVGIHGRAELSASDENISDCNSAPPVIVKERPQRVVAAGAPRSCSHSSSDTHFRERLLESMSAPDAVAHFPGYASNEVVGAWKCNPFALSRAIRKKWRQKTIWNMLSRIDEIPEQVEGMLTQTASDLSMQVDGSVVQMQDRLREASPTGGEQVAETLEMLPRHFANSVEANLMDAAALLRQTVSSVTAELGAKDFEAEDIVQEIQVIPGKVRKVADEVISRAVNASVEELHQQLDEALGVLSASCAVREKELLQHLDQLPVVAEKRLTATGAVVDSAEDKIVDLMADLKSEFVPNHWLMEALLRAKASKGLSREGEAVEVVLSPREIRAENAERSERSERSQDAENGEALGEVADQKLEDSNAEEEADSQVRNPGSLGHPEMCTRPCLFFAAGQCQNRESCKFCHLPHNRRPTHLDKRNREILKSFSSEEKLATILPILSEKLQKYCNNPAAFQLLLQLETLSANSGVDLEAMSTTSSKQTAKGERTLKSALRAVTLRSLLTLLLRTLPKDDRVRHVVEAMICSLRQPE